MGFRGIAVSLTNTTQDPLVRGPAWTRPARNPHLLRKSLGFTKPENSPRPLGLGLRVYGLAFGLFYIFPYWVTEVLIYGVQTTLKPHLLCQTTKTKPKAAPVLIPKAQTEEKK